jgi:hypothetical protein
MRAYHPEMPIAPDSFEPHKRSLGQLLASTSPPLRVPDFQRDYSWGKDEVTDFWEDIIDFGGSDPTKKPSGQYFLGATVLVDNGSYHLVLDGQQRLATATILFAAIRDRIADYKHDAAHQMQDQYIVFTDALNGEKVIRLEMNRFDREFFRGYIQTFPRTALPTPSIKSHGNIANAYNFFAERLSEGWNKAGDGKEGYEWVAHLAMVIRQYIVFIAAISTNEQSAASIFTTLNDRGIGLSTVDLVRSEILQKAHESQRQEILDNWPAVFAACGNDIGAESLMRLSWVAQRGDLKVRALQKEISGSIDNADAESALKYSRRLKEDALLYRALRDGDTDEPDLEECWLSLRPLKFNAGYALLIAACHMLNLEDQKRISRAIRTLVIRRNTVCKLDRAPLESLVYSCAKDLSAGNSLHDVLGKLRSLSPDDDLFDRNFRRLSFGASEHGLARYVLTLLHSELATTEEVTIAGSDKVHVEHIYPQQPVEGESWEHHETYVRRLGNLTLLDKRLNTQIKNGGFGLKKEKAYAASKLEITRQLLAFETWSPAEVDQRQESLLELAREMWPSSLISD